MKKTLLLVMILCFFTGCAAPRDVSQATVTQYRAGSVGICLPDKADPYWAECGELLQDALEDLGCETVVFYSENKAKLQAEQVKELYAQNVSCLVLAAVDAMGLAEPLKSFAAAQIPVIALDRMLMDTEAVKLCVSFDYRQMGQAVGTYIEKELALSTAQQEGRCHTVEFFMGSPSDPNAPALHQGILTVLQPYFGNGVLTCPSGRTSFEDTWVLGEDGAKAEEILRRHIGQYYGENAYPQVLCTASDSLAQGCVRLLEEMECPAGQWPLITGMGGNLDAADIRGQAVTVRKNVSRLVADCAAAACQLVNGGELPADFAQTAAHNHTGYVPVRYCDFEVLTPSWEQQTETETLE